MPRERVRIVITQGNVSEGTTAKAEVFVGEELAAELSTGLDFQSDGHPHFGADRPCPKLAGRSFYDSVLIEER